VVIDIDEYKLSEPDGAAYEARARRKSLLRVVLA
jgi:hypothetical protein